MPQGRINATEFSFIVEMHWKGNRQGIVRASPKLISRRNTQSISLQLPVYVKDVQSQLVPMEKPMQSETQIRTNVQTPHIFQTENDADKRVLALMTVPGRVGEESRQMPLQCSVPLKLNGVQSSVVPVNVENLSSLMQVVPDTEMPRIQQFKLPLQVIHL